MPRHNELKRISKALDSEAHGDMATPPKALAKRRGGPPLAYEPPIARERFLAALAKTGNVTLASRYARICRNAAYEWRDADPAFAAAWQDALSQAADLLEREAVRRATKGVKKPVYQGGELVGYVTEYSDTLLIFLLKGAKPEKYRENVRHEHTGESGGPINVQFFTFTSVANALTAEIADGSAEDR